MPEQKGVSDPLSLSLSLSILLCSSLSVDAVLFIILALLNDALDHSHEDGPWRLLSSGVLSGSLGKWGSGGTRSTRRIIVAPQLLVCEGLLLETEVLCRINCLSFILIKSHIK